MTKQLDLMAEVLTVELLNMPIESRLFDLNKLKLNYGIEPIILVKATTYHRSVMMMLINGNSDCDNMIILN